jgi:lipid-binding SYLF domain-containing protein
MKKGIFSLFAFALLFTMGGWAQNTNGNTKVNNTAPPANQSPTTGAYGKTYGDQDQTKVLKRLDDSAADLNRIVNAPDSGVPQTVLSKAKCVAIVPTLAKGGFIFGAEYGRGVATCRLPNGRWSGPAFFTLTGGSWGAQIGGEAVDLVMLFMNDEGANKLMQAKWKIGGDVGIAAGPWGREGSASTDWKANTGILTYSKAKGAFIGATLNGANVHVDENAMRALYGNHYPNFRAVLTGKTRVPPAANRFLASVRQDFHEASANK